MSLPTWLVADVWNKLSPEAQGNALDVIALMTWDDSEPIGADAVAGGLRGVPERPTWMKMGPKPKSFHADCAALRKSVNAEIRAKHEREQAHAAEVRQRQRTCEHVFDPAPDGVLSRRCGKCGKIV